MRTRALLLCAVVSVAMAADRSYAGKWKIDLAKSDFGQTTFTIESLSGGEWQSSAMGVTYKFKMDGADYPDGMGGTVAWKAIGADTRETVSKANDKVTAIDSFKLAADGNTLTDSTRQMKADGGELDSTTIYQRASGGPSLPGKWKTQKISGASGTMEMVASGADGLTFKDPEMGLSCDARLDGKDYPCTGPMLPPGFTVAMKDVSGSLELVVKKDGKPVFHSTYTASADGQSMTEIGAPVGGSDKFKLVFDRV